MSLDLKMIKDQTGRRVLVTEETFDCVREQDQHTSYIITKAGEKIYCKLSIEDMAEYLMETFKSQKPQKKTKTRTSSQTRQSASASPSEAEVSVSSQEGKPPAALEI